MRRTFVIGSILCAGAFIGAAMIQRCRRFCAVLIRLFGIAIYPDCVAMQQRQDQAARSPRRED